MVGMPTLALRLTVSMSGLALVALMACTRARVTHYSRNSVLPASESDLRGSAEPRTLSGGPWLPPPTEDNEPTFCKLNPGACWPALPPPEPGEPETTADPWKSFACMQACKAGGAAMEKFCENLPNRTNRQKKIRSICWGVSAGTEAACLVFCRAYFGPPRSPSP
jgi:hypothetical protein